MVKNIFSNLSRGIFYTIGRIIAYILIFLLLGYILGHLDLSTIDLSSLIMGVL